MTKMKKARTPIPEDVSAEVMFLHDRACCVCCQPGQAVQIHHIDEDPTNHAVENLVVLCLEHHEQTQIRGGFGKKLKAADIIRHRDDWLRRVLFRRQKADEFVIRQMAAIALPASVVDAEEWEEPSEAKITAYVNMLPSIRSAAIATARPLWDSGITTDMRQGTYNVIEFLGAAWLQLAKFYPPKHFGGKGADRFLSEFIAMRFEWHRRISEPRGPGSMGTIVGVIAGGAVLDDVAGAIAETVVGLYSGYCLNDFDLKKWRNDWTNAEEQHT